MKIKIVVAILMVFSLADVFSQSTNWNDYNRYWYYRYKLVNEFLVRGEESPLTCNEASGYSIPAVVTRTYVDVKWGDGTVELGWYIGVLATEYKLLSLNNQPTENTERELYFAMKAYDRLDRKAERLFYPQNSSANCSNGYLNGLFVRDDVGEELFVDHPEFTTQYMDDQNFSFKSDYYTVSNKGVDKVNAYPSQDQIAHLIMGFALVKKCLGDETYQGYNFVAQAKHYTDKITSRLDANNWIGKLENGEEYKHSETFRNEKTAYGVAKAAESITGKSYQSRFGLSGDLPLAASGWQTYSNNVGFSIVAASYILNHVDFTAALIQSYAAVGSSWEYGLIKVKKSHTIRVPSLCKGFMGVPYPCLKKVKITCYEYEVNAGAIVDLPVPLPPCLPELPDLHIDITSEILARYGYTFQEQFYPLLHEFLHGERSSIGSDFFVSVINSAPCEGPHYKPVDNLTSVAPNGWRGFNRWTRPLSADGFIDIDGYEGEGRFNGLDYMLIYNLYLLTRGQDNITYKNMLNTTSAHNMAAAGKYWSYESLELSGSVQSNASTNNSPVEIVSNTSILLKPGFRIEPGANVNIHLENLTACNTTEGNSGSLRVAALPVVEKDKETIQKEFIDGVTLKLQTKLNALSAEYVNTPTNSYTSLAEYLKNNEARLTVADKEEVENNQIILYPNPTNNEFYLDVYLKEGQNINITMTNIYNDQGKTLFDGFLSAGSNKLKFDIKEFNKGVFTIEVKGEEFYQIKRLIKRNQ